MRLASAVVLRSQSDERLVALARDGHEQAFVALAHRYRRELVAHARRAGSADQAEDVVQQALLSAWSALRRGAEVRDARAWLHRIVRNGAIRVGRDSRADVALDSGLAAPGRTDTTAELRLEARHALAAVARLPDRQRRALELTAIGASSGRDAAAELGVSEGMLRVLVHRARTTLRSGAAAIMPAPLVNWAAGVATDDVTSRVAQLCAGAGVTATVAKVGATVALTVSVVGGAVHALHLAPGPAPAASRHAAGDRLAAGPELERGSPAAASGTVTPTGDRTAVVSAVPAHVGGSTTARPIATGRPATPAGSGPRRHAAAGEHRPFSAPADGENRGTVVRGPSQPDGGSAVDVPADGSAEPPVRSSPASPPETPPATRGRGEEGGTPQEAAAAAPSTDAPPSASATPLAPDALAPTAERAHDHGGDTGAGAAAGAGVLSAGAASVAAGR